MVVVVFSECRNTSTQALGRIGGCYVGGSELMSTTSHTVQVHVL